MYGFAAALFALSVAQQVPAPATPLPERDQVLEAALGFVEALLRGDAPALSAASTPRFSFDGAVVEGREAQARRWRELFAARGASGRDVLRDLVLLTGPEALAQLGEAPPRVAALLRPGAWVAVADVTGRPLVLFLSGDGGRFAVAGMHD